MTVESVSRYVQPTRWIRYDPGAILEPLVDAKSAARLLNELPYLSQWVEQIHEEQLRLEAAGTSRIEGAEFNDQEQIEALRTSVSSDVVLTRSQRQLRAADSTYRWIRSIPTDRRLDAEIILEIHRRMVTGCDDDRCEPGRVRGPDHNVTFGEPRCRGAEGGKDCLSAFDGLCDALTGEFPGHDPIIQGIATHYHIGSMHVFGDGNGRTARASEALMLRAAGVNSLVMVSLSNYYYAHQDEYRAALSEARAGGHDLTPFLRFALQAITTQCNAVAQQIIGNHRKLLFREFARSLFGQLRSPRRRVLAERQLKTLELLLSAGPLGIREVLDRINIDYTHLQHPFRAQIRDLSWLIVLDAIRLEDGRLDINIKWPQQSSESDLVNQWQQLPTAVSASHPAMAQLSSLLGRQS